MPGHAEVSGVIGLPAGAFSLLPHLPGCGLRADTRSHMLRSGQPPDALSDDFDP